MENFPSNINVKCAEMRRKRFKHQAYTICHMFCGWQLFADYKRLINLHKGTLRINILTQECFFNNEAIKSLSIAGALHSWLMDDLKTSGIPTKAIDKAELSVELMVVKDPKSRKGITNIQHNFRCTGTILSGKDLYLVEFHDMAGVQKIINQEHLTSPCNGFAGSCDCGSGTVLC